MENVVSFVVVFALLLFLLFFSVQTTIQTQTSLLTAQKKLLDMKQFEKVVDLEKLYITNEQNGEFNVVNATGTELYDVRVLCWEKNNVDVNALLVGEFNGENTRSVGVLSFFNGYNRIEYNLLENGFSEASLENNNIRCVLVTRRLIRLFEVRS